MKFGVREICNVTFKAAADNQKIGTQEFKKYQPIFTIDTAQTSEMSQESTTVYAQGGRGYNRLIAWEGEKTMTFTVTDALISPMGLAVLSGAGLFTTEDHDIHVHVTMDAKASEAGVIEIKHSDLVDEIGLSLEDTVYVCADDNIKAYGTVVDGTGYGYKWLKNGLTIGGGTKTSDGLVPIEKGKTLTFTVTDTDDIAAAKGNTVKVDFYVALKSGATQITIEPDSFGGYFYVEADTLFRREDDGQDMAATLTFPRVKVQSAFTFSMAASGDPSTFDFTMDAFPGKTQFDQTKKVCVVMDIVGADKEGEVVATEGHKAAHSTTFAKTTTPAGE